MVADAIVMKIVLCLHRFDKVSEQKKKKVMNNSFAKKKNYEECVERMKMWARATK